MLFYGYFSSVRSEARYVVRDLMLGLTFYFKPPSGVQHSIRNQQCS